MLTEVFGVVVFTTLLFLGGVGRGLLTYFDLSLLLATAGAGLCSRLAGCDQSSTELRIRGVLTCLTRAVPRALLLFVSASGRRSGSEASRPSAFAGTPSCGCRTMPVSAARGRSLLSVGIPCMYSARLLHPGLTFKPLPLHNIQSIHAPPSPSGFLAAARKSLLVIDLSENDLASVDHLLGPPPPLLPQLPPPPSSTGLPPPPATPPSPAAPQLPPPPLRAALLRLNPRLRSVASLARARDLTCLDVSHTMVRRTGLCFDHDNTHTAYTAAWFTTLIMPSVTALFTILFTATSACITTSLTAFITAWLTTFFATESRNESQHRSRLENHKASLQHSLAFNVPLARQAAHATLHAPPTAAKLHKTACACPFAALCRLSDAANTWHSSDKRALAPLLPSFSPPVQVADFGPLASCGALSELLADGCPVSVNPTQAPRFNTTQHPRGCFFFFNFCVCER